MKKLIVTLTLSIAIPPPHSKAQTPPPDFYDDMLRQSFGFWENPVPGWVQDTQGNPRPDIQYVTEGALPRAYIQKLAKVSFVLSSVDTSIATTDTLRRLDMSFTGEMFQAPDPVAYMQRGEHLNFYLPHCGPNGVTSVRGYNRILYPNIYPNIDLWMYCGQRGQKIAIVIKPGASPADVQLVFSGQNEMDLDVFGNLKLLLQDKWIVLPEAVAYQYNQDNSIIPMLWTAEYVPNYNTGQVGFTFDAYNPTKPLVLLIGPPPAFGGGDNEEPGLCWSTYYGGDGDDYFVQSCEDTDDNLYITGVTTSAIATFPPTPGMTEYGIGPATCLLKFNPTENVQWKTFFGGNNDYVHPAGCTITQTPFSSGVYIAGRTNSNALVNLHTNQFWEPEPQPSFIAKFRLLDGERTWSTYFPVSAITSIASSANGRVYISGTAIGWTSVAFNSPADFDDPPPSPNSAFWSASTGSPPSGNGVVAMFNTNDRLNWLTYIPHPFICAGGSWIPGGLAVGQNNIVVSGTSSYPFVPAAPCPSSAYCEQLSGKADVLIYEFDLDGVPLWRTFFGQSGRAHGNLISTPRSLVAIDPVTHDIVIAGAVDEYQEIICDFEPWELLPGTVPIEPGPNWYSDDQPFTTTSAFIARFSGIDRHLVWSTYLPGTATSYPDIRAVKFDSEGALYVGGATHGLGVPFNQFGGYYHAESIYDNEGEEQDAFLVCIGPDFSLRFSTYFGGNAAAEQTEYICDILQRSTNGQIYCVGGTSKGADQTTYFPVDDGGGIPDFWPDWAGGELEGYIAAFCPEALTTLPEQGSSGPGSFAVTPIDANHLAVQGLGSGVHRYEILDALGRTVLSDQLTIGGSGKTTLNLPSCGSGWYVLRCGGGSAKFMKL